MVDDPGAWRVADHAGPEESDRAAAPGNAGDELVTPVPRWVLLAGSAVVAGLAITCFLVFWRGMGTVPRESAVEAFGVAFGLLVVVSAIGAFAQATRDDRDRRAVAARSPAAPRP